MFVISTKDLAELFEVSQRTITTWKRLGAESAQIGRGKWDLKKFLQWWLENIYTPVNENEPTLQEERLRYEKARADKVELEVKRLKKELIPRDKVEHALAELIAITKRAFLLLPKKAPGVLKNLSPAEQVEALQKMVDEILEGLADGASFKAIQNKLKA
ncbi:MAG: terminase small subunit [Candidatus Desulfofervidus auxilii]|nr:terminase small subunit [Candidatus Desulfofervidus auxilii]